MKQLIVMVAMVALGLVLFNLIAGDEGSVKSQMKEAFEMEINMRTSYP